MARIEFQLPEQAANHNFPAAVPGSSFYPEMGQKHDGTALFVASYCWKSYTLKWAPERHQEAIDTLRRLKIRAKDVEIFETINGEKKGRCTVTMAAAIKIIGRKLAVIEALLD